MNNFSIDFYRDEIRNGFFIPTAVKLAWAAQLDVLKVIDDICKKHNIQYFADWGTLLGAIRHGGYVPWDDDLDICMKRQDYIRFKEIAETELPDNFCIHDYSTHKNHWLFLSRVVNHSHICFEPEHLKKFHNFPYLASIDIFVLDYLYSDPEEERKRCDEVKYIIGVADSIVNGRINKIAKEQALSKLEQTYSVTFSPSLDDVETGILLYAMAEEQMGRVPEHESDYLGQIFPWILIGKKGISKKEYERLIRVPFEDTTMPVPVNYHKLLHNKYNNYFTLIKGAAGHNYPYFESQKASLALIAGFELPDFAFDKSMLRDVKSSSNSGHGASIDSASKTTENSFKAILTEWLSSLSELQQSFLDTSDINFLAQCQEVALEIGNSIETVYGADTFIIRSIIPSIEEYCELVFHLYNQFTNSSHSDNYTDGTDLTSDPVVTQNAGANHINCLLITEEKVITLINDLIITRKKVAFLPDNPQNWNALLPLYQYYSSQNNTDVYVIPLPLFRKSPYGEILATDDELLNNSHIQDYPPELSILSWSEINLQLWNFDTIIFQNGYDKENMYLTVPPSYYAKELQKYTDNLIYVLPQGIADFDSRDSSSCYGLRHYLTVPGAMYSDKIIYHSESMRSLYLSFLNDFAGEETSEIWNHKLSPITDFTNDTSISETPSDTTSDISKSPFKEVLYCISINEFANDIEYATLKMQERLEIFKDYNKNIHVTLCMYPCCISDWDIYSDIEKRKIQTTLNSVLSESQFTLCNYEDMDITDFNAYYGAPTPLALQFSSNKKPVMIADNK